MTSTYNAGYDDALDCIPPRFPDDAEYMRGYDDACWHLNVTSFDFGEPDTE